MDSQPEMDAEKHQNPEMEDAEKEMAEVPPEEAMKKEEEMAPTSDHVCPYAYWKTYAGIWKILQLIFGTIAIICLIICLTPEWTWERDGPCPYKWTVNGSHTGKFLLEERIDKDIADLEEMEKNKKSGAQLHGKGSGNSRQGGPGGGGIYSPYGREGFPADCYGSLTFPDGDWGFMSGRHDVWLYCWCVIAFCTWIINIVIIVMQVRMPSFVTFYKFPLMIYYGVIWLFIDFCALAMLIHCATHMAWYHNTLPRAVPCMVGAIFSILNAICHAHSMHWNYIHKLP